MNLIKLKNKIRKYKRFFNMLSKIKLHIKGLYFYIFMKLFSIFPINNNKVIVVSYAGKGYGDNGKYIVDKLHERREYINIYWATNKKNKNSLPDFVKNTRFNSLSYLYHLATAKIWINNARFEFGVIKRKKQFYIQTWHSSLRLKKIEKDAIEDMNPQYVKTCIYDSKMIDLIISGCGFSSKIYSNAFWYDGEICECGTPRCDIFFDDSLKLKLKKDICEKYGIDVNKKIVLYAPTFRKGIDESQCYLNFDKLSEYLGEEYVILGRLHPISKYSINFKNKNVYNFTNYPDMQELLCISDFLITDYSGCCFDMMINDKPCLLFTKDLSEYLKKERALYFEFDELPFFRFEKEEELSECIKKFPNDEYKIKVNKFKKQIKLYEKGTASDSVVEIIINKIESKV